VGSCKERARTGCKEGGEEEEGGKKSERWEKKGNISLE